MNKITKKFLAIVLSVLAVISSMSVGLVASAENIPDVIYLCNIYDSDLPAYYVTFPRGYPEDDKDQYFGDSGFMPYGSKLNFMNGFSHAASELNSFIQIMTMDDYKRVLYCIEPGSSVDLTSAIKRIALNKKTGSDIDWDYYARLNSNLTGSQLKTLMCTLAYYGFSNNGNTSYITAWRTNKGNTDEIAKSEATQLLFWELIVGERDANFNHIDPPSNLNSVLDGVNTSCKIYSEIKGFYDSIAAEVKTAVQFPNSAYNTKADSAKDDNVVELEYKNGVYQASIPLGSSVTGLTTSCDNGSVNVSVSGNNLEIKTTMPLTSNATITLSKTINEKNVAIYTDGVFDPNAAGTKQDMVYPLDVNPEVKTSYITVKTVHHHVWIPHKEEPTCTEEGYTVWKCACGLARNDDPATGVDSHVPALGHDSNSPWVTSVEATCETTGTEVQICDQCGLMINSRSVAATKHDDGVWKVDIEATPSRTGQMSRYCTKCGESLETTSFSYHTHMAGETKVVTAATCAQSGVLGTFCKECGACYETSVIPATGHDTANTIWITSTQPTCTAAGEQTGYCPICGEKISTCSVTALGHSGETWTITDYACCTTKGEQVRTCDRCGEVIQTEELEALGHTNGTWITTKAATCTTDGEQSLICDRCGVTINAKTIDATGHTPGKETTVIAATCTEDGEKVVTCEDCGKALSTEKIEKLGHGNLTWVTTTPATCTADGEKCLVCDRCGQSTKTEKIEALGHSSGTWVTNVAATCTEEGEAILVCDTCGGILEVKTIPALDHEGGTSVTVKAPTCTKAGSKVIICDRCGNVTETTEIPATGHSNGVYRIDVEPTVNHSGMMTPYCTKCGEAIGESVEIPYHTHEEGYRKTTVAATCTAKGEEVSICKHCGVAFASYEIPALGHEYSDIYTNNDGTHSKKCSRCQVVITENCTFEDAQTAATCLYGGYTVHTCSVCGYSVRDSEVAPLGHDWSIWMPDSNALTHTRTCKRCGTTETDVHYWSDWYTVSKTTGDDYSVTEYLERMCDTCGVKEKYDQTTPHEHALTKHDLVPSTCTEAGSKEYYSCDTCGKYFEDSAGLMEIEEDSWIIPAHGHDYSIVQVTKQPTCTEPGESIKVCSYDSSHTTAGDPVPPLGHEFGRWIDDENGTTHTHTCIRGDVTGTEDHEWGSWSFFREEEEPNTDKTIYLERFCDDCGAREVMTQFVSHTHDGYAVDAVAPTCTREGNIEYWVCSHCGKYFSDSKYTNEIEESAVLIPALGHDFGEWIDDENGTTHTHYCSRGDKNEPNDHNWSNWEKTGEETLENGDRIIYMERHCEDCGAVQKDSKPVVHDHVLAGYEAVSPTCTTAGNIEYWKCVLCNKYYSDENGNTEIAAEDIIIPALGHDFGEWIDDGNGTTHTHNCVRGDKHETEDHSWGEWQKVNEVTADNGDKTVYYESTCTDCGAKQEKSEVIAHTHTGIKHEEVKSKCTEDGTKEYWECEYCGKIFSDENYTAETTLNDLVIPAHGHDYHYIAEESREATQDIPGYKYFECSYDASHNYMETTYYVGNLSTGKKADYDNDTGIATITLSASADSKETEVIDVNPEPVDVVLVLDTSGSMADEDADGDVKLTSLKTTAKNFIKQMADGEADNRVAVVNFAGGGEYWVGRKKYTYDDYKINGVLNSTDYANALLSAKQSESTLEGYIDGLKANGATRADYGMKQAEKIIAQRSNEYAKRKVVVIFITDGVPTRESDFDTDVANNTISYAETLKKDYSATIYSIGFAIGNSQSNMSTFMNCTSSNYPDATSMTQKGDKNTDGKDYFITAADANGLKVIIDGITKTIIQPVVPFSNLTVYDTISKEFTMTEKQEADFRQSVIAEYGIKNEDITVIKNDDGTTSVKVRNLEPKVTDNADGTKKYDVSVTFSVTANQYAEGNSYYNTNTSNAYILAGNFKVGSFKSPRVLTEDNRNIIAFYVEDRIYEIDEVELGEKAKLPGIDGVTWDKEDGFTVEESYTEVHGTRNTETVTITWVTADKTESKDYKKDQLIIVPEVKETADKKFLGWDNEIPIYAEENMTFTAQYKDHDHNFEKISQYGSCEDGITYLYACSCGSSYTFQNASEEHELTATIADIDGVSRALVECSKCNYYQEKYINYKAMYSEEDGTITNQVFDLKMYNSSDVSVQPDGTIEVILPAEPELLNSSNLRVYRVNSDGSEEDVSYRVEDGNLVMSLDHFSYYVISTDPIFETDTTYGKIQCALGDGHNYVADANGNEICSSCGDIRSSGHTDADGDGICDTCGSSTGTAAKIDCSHFCHSTNWLTRIFYRICRFFWKIFRINKYCECGEAHY